MSRRRSTFTPLTIPAFRRFWLGQTASQFGNAVVPIALTLSVLRTTGSAVDLGIVLTTTAVAEALFFLPAGVWADRLPRRAVMCVAEVARAGSQFVIAALLATGNANAFNLSCAVAVTGVASAFFLSASNGLLAETVPTSERQGANALLGLSKRTAALMGPTAATAVVTFAGPQWIFTFDAVTFLFSALMLGTLKVPRSGRRPREGFITELVHGWREVTSRRWYWTNLLVHGSWNLGRCVFFTVGPLVAVKALGGEVAWGVIIQGGSIGAFAGVLLGLRLRPRSPLVVANVVYALGALPLLLLAIQAPVSLIAVATGLMYSALGIGGTLWDTLVQEKIPSDVISRVSAYDWLLSVCLTPIGLASAGPLALRIGDSATLLGGAALLALPALAVLLVPEVRRTRLNHEDTPSSPAEGQPSAMQQAT
ncbi:MFS transporter [Streptomyces osmaniensis]|uniref:MFS transporter n=1 Tax=Streptomyces osmaniensis TaxID=593134 RepID=A0ABP6XQR5_9ACTN|nr:MFS transporter [Streptomyces sp. JCM17656]